MIYDRFQKEAIDYINQGYSVIVCAPTGAGKTAIAE
ncbi:MAG: DEAD/DEAH box helicase, partial [Candidatus Omnitrophica bacterium]|nr:DEAD/DEAH box helicase [Candidatus Omnitrophota bacterium]